jgi:glyoxylase-like metal-dependent hydrolase (beta-lactamase superfamily II)
MLTYASLTVGAFQVNCRFITSKETKRCVICDPGDNAAVIINHARKNNLDPAAVILTHGHLDHCGAAVEVADALKIPVIGPHRNDELWLSNLDKQAKMFGLESKPALVPDRYLNDGEILDLDIGEKILVLHCPGHTPGQVCYYFRESGFLLSGDVLFAGSVGRSDFPGGDHDDLINSIKNKILILPDDTAVLPGHGPDTTVGEEKNRNPYLCY